MIDIDRKTGVVEPFCIELQRPVGDVDVKHCLVSCTAVQMRRCLDEWIEYDKLRDYIRLKWRKNKS